MDATRGRHLVASHWSDTWVTDAIRIKIRDLNGDVLDDLALFFRKKDLLHGGVLNKNSDTGVLLGQLNDGTQIKGSDSLRVCQNSTGRETCHQTTLVTHPAEGVLEAASRP